MIGCQLLTMIPLSCSVAASGTVTTGSLVAETVDLARLCDYPSPAYKLVQFSSYDRRSVAPYAPGWYANSDGFGGEPIPNFLSVLEPPGADSIGRYLLALVNGPGAIVRTWTAAIAGDLTVYLDGETEPLYRGSAERFLLSPYSCFAPQQGIANAAEERGFHQNQACYFPIPFAKGLRIEWTGRLSEIHFYAVEVREYAHGTPVRTFSPSDVVTYGPGIESARRVLESPDAHWTPPAGAKRREIAVEVPAGRAVDLVQLDGPASVCELGLLVSAEDLTKALRGIVLKGYFDGAAQPQIEAPVGDFFGAGPGVNPYDSLPITVRADGTMVCRFPMPYARAAKFVLDNRSGAAGRVAGWVSTVPKAWEPGRTLHFFSKWRVDHGLETHGSTGDYDLPFIAARGRGTYVGTASILLNPTDVPTPGGGWWGEGDEKVWVDDDTFPSLFGTGSEDYYNYAWSRPDLFSCAYCAQPLNSGPGNRGFVTNNRWHILDAIPFMKSLDFSMELIHHTHTTGLSYARLAVFYGTPDVRDDHVPITAAAVTQGLELPADWLPKAEGQARGAIFVQAEAALVQDRDGVRIVTGRMWSGGRLLQWTPTGPGDRLSFRVACPADGRYQIVATAARTPSSGKFRVAVDGGAALAEVADAYTPHQTMLWNYFLDAVQLSAGEHTVDVEACGADPASSGAEIGLDFLWLLPVRS